MKRGEIWTIAVSGSYATKPRPALIIQSDQFDATESVTFFPFTSRNLDAPLARVQIEPDEYNGLRSVSFVMVDKISTKPRTSFGDRVGSISKPDMLRVERYAIVFLGIAD